MEEELVRIMKCREIYIPKTLYKQYIKKMLSVTLPAHNLLIAVFSSLSDKD